MDRYLTPGEILALHRLVEVLGAGGKYRCGKEVVRLFKIGAEADEAGQALPNGEDGDIELFAGLVDPSAQEGGDVIHKNNFAVIITSSMGDIGCALSTRIRNSLHISPPKHPNFRIISKSRIYSAASV